MKSATPCKYLTHWGPVRFACKRQNAMCAHRVLGEASAVDDFLVGVYPFSLSRFRIVRTHTLPCNVFGSAFATSRDSTPAPGGRRRRNAHRIVLSCALDVFRQPCFLPRFPFTLWKSLTRLRHASSEGCTPLSFDYSEPDSAEGKWLHTGIFWRMPVEEAQCTGCSIHERRQTLRTPSAAQA